MSTTLVFKEKLHSGVGLLYHVKLKWIPRNINILCFQSWTLLIKGEEQKSSEF